MHDDPLTPAERKEIARLPREADLPAGLEDRVVAAVREAGHLSRRRHASSAIRIAAAVAIFVGGALIGRLTAGWQMSPASAEPTFLLLLYGAAASPQEGPARFAEYAAWAGSLRADDRLIAAERLAPDQRILGAADGGGDHDQPVGFFLIRADSVEAAAAVAATCPHLRYGGTVVVRPAG